jgi:UDP-N-acetylglucosamine--N-acetylmuramyl-(pentapeptide) pyrophosphoryl-undecaprenol N-acetylglucosamine transferase
MKIIFSGGGTLGPVTPLLAIKEIIAQEYPDAKFVWVGTVHGPERELVEKAGIEFRTIASGKLRRYFSFLNFFDLFRFVIGFFQSLKFIWKQNPDVCISAGGFVSVPLHYAAALLGTPTWIHQQDVKVGLANRLMSSCARLITTATREEKSEFPARKTVWLGNPVRKDILRGEKEKAKKIFGLSGTLPVVFVTGGGTGSAMVNQMVVEALPHLEGVCEIIHLSGKERPHDLTERAAKHSKLYHTYEFFTDEMKHAYAGAHLIVSRGGFGSLTELAALQKAAIVIPKPGHQEENVAFLKHANAVVMLDERNDSGLALAKLIRELLAHPERLKELGITLHEVLPPASEELVLELFRKSML